MAIRAAWALILANLRYWSQLAPELREQIRHWEQRAAEIEDPELHALALSKLRRERFNAEAAAMIATLAPAPHRRAAAQAILSLELMFDYLDGLTERPLGDPIADGEALYAAFVGAFDPRERDAEAALHSRSGETADPYLAELASTARTAIAELPAHAAIMPIAQRCARAAAQAQVRMHAAPRLGAAQLEQWARAQAGAAALPWRDFLAGSACSVLALHALIVAASDPRTTPERAEQIATVYTPICTAMTLLDGLIDIERDALAGQHSYAALYESPESLAAALIRAVGNARLACAPLADGSRHAMVLTAAVAYWLSEPNALSGAAAPILAQVRAELGPLLPVPLALMHAWRGVKRLRSLAPGGRRISETHAGAMCRYRQRMVGQK
jgi:tetraprenyl-beta-curcumene synthase